MREALSLLDFEDESISDVRALLVRAAFTPAFLKATEGRRFLSYLFTLQVCCPSTQKISDGLSLSGTVAYRPIYIGRLAPAPTLLHTFFTSTAGRRFLSCTVTLQVCCMQIRLETQNKPVPCLVLQAACCLGASE